MGYALIHLVILSERLMLPCMSKTMFGIECPGCGLQRSVALLLEGEFWAAFKMYPAIYAIIALFGFLIYDYLFKVKYSNRINMVLMILAVGLILINYILKFI